LPAFGVGEKLVNSPLAIVRNAVVCRYAGPIAGVTARQGKNFSGATVLVPMDNIARKAQEDADADE